MSDAVDRRRFLHGAAACATVLATRRATDSWLHAQTPPAARRRIFDIKIGRAHV